ncbi:MAG: chemotaxis protein CheW [Bryobacteraceae bacterium]|jgi:purine-binding chemotaxis protein CheW
MTATPQRGLRRFATFSVANMFCGIDVGQVQEVLKHQDMTPVPLAPGVIQGLINLRGQIVTAIDLRRRFRLPEGTGGREAMNMVLRCDGGAVSLLVDSIGDVLEVDGAEHEPPPSTMDPFHRELVEAVFKLDGKLLLALDTAKVLNIEGEI